MSWNLRIMLKTWVKFISYFNITTSIDRPRKFKHFYKQRPAVRIFQGRVDNSKLWSNFDKIYLKVEISNIRNRGRTGGCHPLPNIDRWQSTRATRSNDGPANFTSFWEHLSLFFIKNTIVYIKVKKIGERRFLEEKNMENTVKNALK